METVRGGPSWALDQIQGFLLRGYRMSFARYFALTVTDLAAARSIIAGLTDPASGDLQITNALHWGETPPEYCLNLGFTYAGLTTFEIPASDLAVLKTDPNYSSFAIGATTQAASLYETRPTDPAWILDDRQFHVLVTLWSNDETSLDTWSGKLKTAIAAGFSLDEAKIIDSQALDNGMVYFGYQDGIAQPIIKGTPFSRQPDGGQDLVDPSAFMIGTGSNIYQALPFSVQKYGCFGAFMVIRQDVEAFDAQVKAVAPQLGAAMKVTDPNVQELAVKAVFCGRWPNGTPLEVFPIDGNKFPPSEPPPQKVNDFNYGTGATMDPGTTCPVGAHIRRGNMRVNAGDDGGSNIGFQGTPSSHHRILRRAMPYQKPFKPDDRHCPQTERGLAGLFLGTSLMQQYELVYGSWVNAQFAADMTLADPVIGVPDPGAVELPTASLSDTIGPVNSCVTVMSNAYLFYPGIPAIRTIATGTIPQ